MMRLSEIFEGRPEGSTEHANETGFYGKWGAGCIVFARSTKRFLIAHRSDNPPPFNVEQPNTWGTWGTWGGAADRGEKKPEDVVRRELAEEAGHDLPADLVPMYTFKSGSFRYYNFLAIIDDEFIPHLGWETQGFRWCEFGEWPSPLHFGLQAVLNDARSITVMQNAIASATPPERRHR